MTAPIAAPTLLVPKHASGNRHEPHLEPAVQGLGDSLQHRQRVALVVGVLEAGDHALPILLPPGLQGFTVYSQVFVLDPAAPSWLAASNVMVSEEKGS